MASVQIDTPVFEMLIRRLFVFLERDCSIHYAGTRRFERDPRDSYLAAKYLQDAFRIDVTWTRHSMALGVLIHVESADLPRRERYIYLKPFLEFISSGQISPIVPQLYPSMNITDIERTMRRRSQLFEPGIEGAVSDIASRLEGHLPAIRSCSAEAIRRYHAWYQSR